MAMRRLLAVTLLALLLGGCGGDGDEGAEPPTAPPPPGAAEPPPAATTEGPPPAAPRRVSLYFLREGELAVVRREVAGTPAVARAALEALADGPTAAERGANLATRVPDGLEITQLAIEGGTARTELQPCPPMAQVVFTLTQFPSVRRVRSSCLEGGAVSRGDFEEDLPAIFVESPAQGEEVRSPLRIRGTANTFEANFQINVVDWDGRIVKEQFATATSGTGTRGTFDVTVPFTVDRPGGALIVFEDSAKDGRPMNVVEIPLRLQPAG